MKKVIILSILSVVIFACKTNTATKLDNKTEVAMKGNWVVSSVNYPGSEVIKVNSFDLADSQCFVGSTWRFISNNNKGDMALTKMGCPAFSSPITWFVNKEGNFVMKVLDAGEKAKRVREGYVLKVANVSENAFQLVDRINVGGTIADVVYQFQRVN
ncbi:lipocalin family protein [Flavobacterium sp. UBA6135]|uniref:lipocalin family protein n=1 Tax=Flavobacterium sp. UBA6135 TaxID=1946553 RepID=UPI0025B93E14|nr:lipocalin family protein [Flavobacterium sp. UBA6135]